MGSISVPREQSKEQQLVCRYHALRFNRSRHSPTASELEFARDKLGVYNEDLLNLLLPTIAQLMERDFPKGKYFSAAAPYIDEVMTGHLKEQAARRKREETERLAEAEHHETHQAKETRRERDATLIARFESLSRAAKEKLWKEALASAPSEFDRDQMERARKADKPHFVLLQVLDRRQGHRSNNAV